MPGSRSVGGAGVGESRRGRRPPQRTPEEVAAQEEAEALAAFNRGVTRARFVSPKINAQDLADALGAAAADLQ
jgi:hypothetical protein